MRLEISAPIATHIPRVNRFALCWAVAVVLALLGTIACPAEAAVLPDDFEINDVSVVDETTICGIGYLLSDPFAPIIALSDDEGKTWMRSQADIDIGRLLFVDFCGPTSGVASGWVSPGGTPLILRTNDSGHTWQSVSAPTEVSDCGQVVLGPEGMALFVSCKGDAGVQIALQSLDGATWAASRTVLPCSNVVGRDLPSAEVWYAICTGSDEGGIWKSIDGGITWEQLLLPRSVGELVDICFAGETRGHILSVADEAALLLTTEDGGESWIVELLPEAETPPIALSIRPDNSLVVLYGPTADQSAQMLGVYQVTGGCIVFTEICNNIDDDCDGQVDESDPNLGTACDGADSDELSLIHI